MSDAKPKRKRPRTAQSRVNLKQALESAIMAPSSTVLRCFTRNGRIFSANLHNVINHLPDDGHCEKYLGLNSFALKSINNRTRVFTINGEVTQSPDQLTIEFQTKLRAKISQTIAYVDNLPLLVTRDRLCRRASIFGTVVNIVMPPPRRIIQKHPILRGSVKVAHAGYAFVQFTNPRSVKRFCRRYISNSHLRRHLRRSRRTRRARLLSRQASLLTANTAPKPSILPVLHYEATTTSPPFVVPDISLTMQSNLSGSCSQVEWSGMESGLESDTDQIRPKRNRKLTFNLSDVAPVAPAVSTASEETAPRKKIRRKRSRNPSTMNLRRLFRNIQVFPLRVYRRLKKEYYQLKRLSLKGKSSINNLS